MGYEDDQDDIFESAREITRLQTQIEAVRMAGQRVLSDIHDGAETDTNWEQLEHALKAIGCRL